MTIHDRAPGDQSQEADADLLPPWHDSLDLTSSDRALIRRALWTLAAEVGKTGPVGRRAIALAERKFPRPM